MTLRLRYPSPKAVSVGVIIACLWLQGLLLGLYLGFRAGCQP